MFFCNTTNNSKTQRFLPGFTIVKHSETLKEEMQKRRKQSPAARLTNVFSSLRSNRQQPTKAKSIEKSTISTSSSASQLIEKANEQKSGRLSATLDENMENEMIRADRIARTPSPRRPMSASSLLALATINESVSSRVQSDDEESEIMMRDDDKRPELMALNGSVSSNRTRHRSGSLDSIDSTNYVPSHALNCFCLHIHKRRGGKALSTNLYTHSQN